MSLPPYPPWFNIVIYQGLWFTAVLGQQRFELWLLLPIALHLLLCRDRASEIAVLLACTLLGSTVDSILALSGLFVFSPIPEPLPIPLWLVAIWVGFAATLRHSLSFLIDRPLIGLPAAAVCAPLSYLGAAQTGAVLLPLGPLHTYPVLLVVWLLLTGTLVGVVRVLSRTRATVPIENR